MLEDIALQNKLIKLYYDHLYIRYFSIARTLNLLSQKYYWPKIDQDIDEYVRTYEIC
jgi:hypothetical protein